MDTEMAQVSRGWLRLPAQGYEHVGRKATSKLFQQAYSDTSAGVSTKWVASTDTGSRLWDVGSTWVAPAQTVSGPQISVSATGRCQRP